MSFCDDAFGAGKMERTERLDIDFHEWTEYYNVQISDYTCIGDKKIGDACPADCVRGACKKGQCTLL